MTSPSPVPDTGTVRSDSAASTRDSATQIAELAAQAIILLQKADDPHTVVAGLLKEKNYLHTQNGQLWRLVDKQRAALLDLQRDYQKVLQEKNKYQARLKALKQLDGTKQFDQNSSSTESSGLVTNDPEGPQDSIKSPSRRSSARSTRSARPPRSPQPNAQLDALQASLEEEIAKSEPEPPTTPPKVQEPIPTDELNEPTIIVNTSSLHPTPIKVRKVPTPLNLAPARPILLTEGMPRSALLAPRSDDSSRSGRTTPLREPPPSAPPQQTMMPMNLSPPTRITPPLRSPGLPKSPRPIHSTSQVFPPTSSEAGLEEPKPPFQAQRGPLSTPQTSKPSTDTDELSDESSTSPRTPAPISPRDVLVEVARKSPLVPRRSRMPSNRSTTSTSQSSLSMITVNPPPENNPPLSTPVVTRQRRSMSVEAKDQPRMLVPPEDALERRKSRSFDDLHALALSATLSQDSISTTALSPDPSLTGIGLDEAIREMQEENNRAKEQERVREEERLAAEQEQERLEKEREEEKLREEERVKEEEKAKELERAREMGKAREALALKDISDSETQPQPTESMPSPPRRSPPEVPPQTPSPSSTLQPPFSGRARSRSSSNVSKTVPLAILPNAITTIMLTVLSVRSRKMHFGNDETLFTIRCRLKNDKSTELLRVEKPYGSLIELGGKLSHLAGMPQFIKSFFDGFPPDKSDQRKAVDYFFDVVLGSQLDDRALYAVAEYLSSDIVQKHDSQIIGKRTSLPVSTLTQSPTKTEAPTTSLNEAGNPVKEGYLTKRGKNFGGWQTRYFVLDGPQLKYFDTPNGVHLGSIKLPQAQIGRQNNQANDDSTDEQMKYAFLILEPKRNDSSKMVRHVLCSQTDEERDDWINCLLHYVVLDAEPALASAPATGESRGKRLLRRQGSDKSQSESGSVTVQPTLSENASDSDTIGLRYDQMSQGRRPTTETARPSVDDVRTRSPEQLRVAPPNVPVRSPYRTAISAPMNGAPITDESAWTNAQREEERRREEKRARKRSVWGFLSKDGRGRSTPENVQATAPPPAALLQHGLFGIPLRDAVEITREMGMGINVPSVVYRCVEYLEHMDAAKEEGIYRLSGSNSAIRLLKDRFNSEGDVDLIHSKDFHDVHAVAGLLKLYLRELPSTVLTRERHVDFLHIVDIEDKQKRIQKLVELVHGLPKVNFELLRIMSKHLKRIVHHAQENKMTIRNVGIVFSPTLNIPAPVFSLFITEYDVVFDEPDEPQVISSTVLTDSPPMYNNIHNSPPMSRTNHHLGVPEAQSHRRYHSADPPTRNPAQGPPSFPIHNQGYREQSPPYQQYPQSSQQYAYQQQVYPQYSSQAMSSRWNESQESKDLFG